MMYTEEQIINEFKVVRYAHTEGWFDRLVKLVNSLYDRVKDMPLERLKALLPFSPNEHGDYVGFNCQTPHGWSACIRDWYGDRTSTEICKATGDTEDEVLRKLLILYINYSSHNRPKDFTETITKGITEG